ncbi:hypothetical protein [Candidatus Hodarchaeum mangrovi]
MPHAVINGNISIENVFKDIKPIFIRFNDTILKTNEFFISKDKKTILIDALCVETGKNNSFFMMLNQRDDGIVVRISPITEIDKTDGVKMLLAQITKSILKSYDKVTLGKTNLEKYLEMNLLE